MVSYEWLLNLVSEHFELVIYMKNNHVFQHMDNFFFNLGKTQRLCNSALDCLKYLH